MSPFLGNQIAERICSRVVTRSMNLKDLVNVSAAVAGTRSRLKKRAALAECLRAAGTSEIELVVNYLGGVMPQGRIGLGPAMVSSALDAAEGGSDSVTLVELDRIVDDIATQSGPGSKGRKEALFGALLNRVDVDEQRFLAGLVLGELRQGALEGVLVDAIADATELPAAEIRRAVMLAADPAPVASAALAEGAPGLVQFRLEPLKPVRPMLATPAEDIGDAMSTLGEAVLQVKLDGARIQVHRVDDEVRIFTRQMNEVTDRLPEIVETVSALPAKSLILDGEAIAMNDQGRPLPFQVTMRRFGRSSNIEAMRESLPLSGFFFDCLYVDGDPRIDDSLDARLDTLALLLPKDALVDQLTTDDASAASRFLARAYDAGHEGLMAKSLASPYAAGNRGAEWLKIKQSHTLDLVILAAEWGSGRRKGFLSNLHLGARNGDGSYVMLGKTFKGLTDRLLKWQTKALLEREIGRDGNTVHVKPELVAEIAISDIQQSQQYPGGLALRFARVKRYRDDKTPAEADTIDTVRSLYRQFHA